MTISKNSTVIPISFVPGSGGRFLNYILNSTKATVGSINVDLEGMYNLVVAFGNMKVQSQSMLVPAQNQINDLLNYAIDKDVGTLEYCSCHVLDIDMLLNNFQKVIQITYEESDLADISFSFISENIPEDIKAVSSATVNNNMTYISNFKTNNDETSFLRVTWKELYKEDIDALITKLSNFLNIHKDLFDIDEIIKWRKQTNININRVKELLGDDIKKIVVWKKEGNTTYRNKLLSLTKYSTGD